MPRGAKPGENRFKGAQKALTKYRLNRLKDIVVPKLRALAAHTSISSINKFCSLAADIYNEDLPVNENPISYRRLNQSKDYWAIVGPVYYQHFAKKKNLEDFKASSTSTLNSQRVNELDKQIERLQAENRALRLSLGSLPKSPEKADTGDSERSQRDIDNMGKVIELLIAKYGVVEVDLEGIALRDLADDLEEVEGMLPKDVVESYIRWLKNKSSKLNGAV
ncbi:MULTISPECIES: hypothetical protein [unclassified Marinobacterium]|uniref:hypothetical protein n=1 Tax=unclassified Marinobacterium TaxID=2644139 RepID=UPI001568D16C|nr:MULTISPECIES: hypothetical protein [unclassified Marinobacterium]NRP09354.1 hypothetical protein [Marinobacterium sp. xm-g-48]NRP82115.1 hypothetical protein [Marinobacterium sp. xm-d-509]